MTIQRDSFVFYRSFKEGLADLPDSDKLTMYEAISDYALDRIEPVLTGFPKMLFRLIKPQLDANFRRWENGCRGGAPKGSRNNPNGRKGTNQELTKNQPRTNQELTENKPNDNVNVNANVNANAKKEKYKEKIISQISEDEMRFAEGMKTTYPRVAMMKDPLSFKQYQAIVGEYGADAVRHKLEEMENWEALSKKHSANLTLRNWLRKDKQQL